MHAYRRLGTMGNYPKPRRRLRARRAFLEHARAFAAAYASRTHRYSLRRVLLPMTLTLSPSKMGSAKSSSAESAALLYSLARKASKEASVFLFSTSTRWGFQRRPQAARGISSQIIRKARTGIKNPNCLIPRCAQRRFARVLVHLAGSAHRHVRAQRTYFMVGTS